MKESFPKKYESSDETIQIAQDRGDHVVAGEEEPKRRRSRKKLGGGAIDVARSNPEALAVAHRLARGEDGRVDYGRILQAKDGSLMVYNSREERDRAKGQLGDSIE